MKHSFKNETELLVWALKADADAVGYCLAIGRLSQVLDDLVDGDKPVSIEQVVRVFWLMLIELPQNAFIAKYGGQILPVLAAAFNSWLDANELEQGSEHDKTLAFVLRDALVDVVCTAAYCLGGYTWLREVSVVVRRFLLDESFVDYVTKLDEV